MGPGEDGLDVRHVRLSSANCDREYAHLACSSPRQASGHRDANLGADDVRSRCRFLSWHRCMRAVYQRQSRKPQVTPEARS